LYECTFINEASIFEKETIARNWWQPWDHCPVPIRSMNLIKHVLTSSLNKKIKFSVSGAIMSPGVNVIKLFPPSLMMRPNKLEHLSLETLSSQVLEFEGKAIAYPIGAPFRCFLPGQASGVTSKCQTRLKSDCQLQIL
jgi:hypothetical protein